MTQDKTRELQEREDRNKAQFYELHQRLDDVEDLARNGTTFFQELTDLFYRSADSFLYEQALDTDKYQTKRTKQHLADEDEKLQQERRAIYFEQEEWERKKRQEDKDEH